jgi:CRISPR/Cas system-associated exonuclease Cas4 (RecB family)
MKIDMLPEPIWKKIVEDTAGYEPEIGTYHVSELIYCLRKAYFRRMYRDQITLNPTLRWYYYRGLLFDKIWTKCFDLNQVPVQKVCGEYTIIGRIDFIYENKIYELKTSFYLPKEPSVKHLAQVNCYSAMSGIKEARLLYISFSGYPRIFTVDTSNSQDILNLVSLHAGILHGCLKDKNPPAPNNEEWECRNCEVKEICQKEKDVRAVDRKE